MQEQSEEHKAQRAAAVIQIAEKNDLLKSLASNYTETLRATADYRACTEQVCAELQAEVLLRDDKIQPLKKRRKSPGGSRKKTRSPDHTQERGKSNAKSWAAFSVRTHERTMGQKPRSNNPGSQFSGARAASAHPGGQRLRDVETSIARSGSAVYSTRIRSSKGRGNDQSRVSTGIKRYREVVRKDDITDDARPVQFSGLISTGQVGAISRTRDTD